MKFLFSTYIVIFLGLSTLLHGMQNNSNSKKICLWNNVNRESMTLNPVHKELNLFLNHLQIVAYRTKKNFSLEKSDVQIINNATEFFQINKYNFFCPPYSVSNSDFRIYNDFFEANVLFTQELLETIEQNNHQLTQATINNLHECLKILKMHVKFNKSIMQ